MIPKLLGLSLVILMGLECEKNFVPSAPQAKIDPYYPTTADDLEALVAVSSEDMNNDPITYRYLWSVDGVERPDLTGPHVSWTETQRGQLWGVAITPYDGMDEGTSHSFEVTVANAPPAVQVAIVPAEPLPHDDLTAVSSVTDLDGDTVDVNYVWTLAGDEVSTWEGATLSAEYTARGDHWTVTATPNDGYEDGTAATAEADIYNHPPEVTEVLLGPDPATRHDTLQATVNARDEDGDKITFQYDWVVDGETVQEGVVDTLEPSLFVRGQRVLVVVTANDGSVDSSPVSSDQLIIENAVPTAKAATLDPTEAYETTTFSCLVTGWSDADDDSEGYLYSWLVNSVEVEADGDTLDGTYFDRDDNVACVATPWDGYDEGVALSATAVDVENTPPEITSLIISTTAPVTDDTLSASVATADEDGDTVYLSYEWYVSGTLTSTDETLSGDVFDKGDTVHVVVTPSDGTDDGAAVTSDTATVVNTTPVISSVSLSPEECYTDDTITATVVSSDEDGDPITITYSWTVDGVVVGASGDTLDGASWFDKHEEVQVTVTPNDGDVDGESLVSSTITALNTAPEAPEIAIDPADPAEADDLICTVDIEAPDTDLDTINYTVVWTRDGELFESASTTTIDDDTVAADHTSSGEFWSCTITPDDGEVDGPSDSAEVTICPPGSESDCPAVSCAEAMDSHDTPVDGSYWLDPEGGSAYEAWCDMSTDDGGWTLLAVVSDDGQDTWTWYDRHLWDSDETSFGELTALDEDFKSPAFHEMEFQDLLFIHQPSGDWASYHSVGDGLDDLGSFIDWYGGSTCWSDGYGYEMSDGSIGVYLSLCSTQLYFNAEDHDGGTNCSCADCADHAYGPTWSAVANTGCPFDDPATSSGLGPNAADSGTESTAIGFGDALNLNTGTAGAGENLMLVYAR